MTRLAKKIDACFRYFPYGFDKPRSYENWLYGPVFAAKVIGKEGAEDLSVFAGLGIYKDRDTSNELKSIIETHDLHDAGIMEKKHSEFCSGRTVSPSITEKIEIAYPLYDLAKLLGVTKYKQSAMVIYGFTAEDELVWFAAARYQTDNCFRTKKEKAASKKPKDLA